MTKLVPIGPVVPEEKSDKVFPIGSYVKRSHTVAAILDGAHTCRNQFLKGTTQELLWPSLVTIGPIVSEEKIDKAFPPHCRPPLQKNLGRGSPFNVSYQHCCKKNINVNDSQNLAFATSHFVIELLDWLFE